MKLETKSQIEKTASKDQAGYVLLDAYLNVDDKTLVTSNGRILAVVPCEIEDGDTSGSVSVEAIKASRKMFKRQEKLSVKANSKLVVTDGVSSTTLEREDKGNYPNYKQVVPNFDKQVTYKVSLNAALLLDLAQSLGDKIVNLELTVDKDGPDKGQCLSAIKVTSSANGVDGAYGVIMPVRMS